MEEEFCEVCTNELDATDSSISFCDCNYSLCLWCFHRICEDAKKENMPGRCPNCRAEFDEERIRKQRLDPAKLEEVKKKQKKDEKKKAAPVMKMRKDLVNVRVVQRNLVYVVGLALELCYEDLLRGPEYFGQFGKVIKISVSRAGPYSTAAAKNGPTGSAYITYRRAADAKRCIEIVHGAMWEGKVMKACYGTTKYCNAFLKGLVCNNSDCLYLHDVADEEDSYTKEETKTPKFVNLVHAASIQKQASQALLGVAPGTNGTPRTHAANGHAASVAGQGPSDADRSGLVTSSLPEPLSEQQAGTSGTAWPALGAASWAAKAVTPAAAPAPQPPPLPAEDSKQDWPELPGAIMDSPEATRAGSMAPVAPVAAQLQRKGSTMAAELARAASAPNGAAAAAKAPAARQPAANAVLVVPKKKGAAAVRTPKKSTVAPVPSPAAAAAEGQESKAAEVTLPSSTVSANGNAAELGSPVASASKAAEAASNSKSGKKQVDAEAAARGDSQEPSKQPGLHADQELSAQEDDGKPGQLLHGDTSGRKAGPPPGFEAINGAPPTNGRPKKGPPPGFVAPEGGTAFASCGSPFQSFGSESSTTSAVREHHFPALAPAGATPVKPPAQHPGWVDPAASLPSLDSIWGTALEQPTPLAAQIPLLPPSSRSRSRFQFAQGSTDESSSSGGTASSSSGGTSGQSRSERINSKESDISVSHWASGLGSNSHMANIARASDPAGMALLRQLQSGPNGAGHLSGYGSGGLSGLTGHMGGLDLALQPGYRQYEMPSPTPLGKPFHAPPAGPPGYAQQQQVQHNGFHAGANGMAVPPSQLGPDVQSLESCWLDANQRFRNMAV
ncbi:probable CCR4-NOT transcription complex subunit 4 at N-terminal half [Coccomyxa sp. Obi]|nr:probable CCR4-NOT transcription complex subunit 4 at N-terminal half [Coccomyxa sp. Obi]